MSYNGWTNWETWNIAMWITNDEMFNRIMTQAAEGNWETFKELAANWGIIKTPDGVYFESANVDQNQLYDTYKQNQSLKKEDIEEEEEECPVLEGRRLLRTRSFYI